MSYKFYQYSKCSGCKKAEKYLEGKGIKFKKIEIREIPPTKTELKKMLSFYNGEIKKLFNTSGIDYRFLNLKEKLPELSKEDAINLLNSNGNLVKRPFLLGSDFGAVGFKEDIYKKIKKGS